MKRLIPFFLFVAFLSGCGSKEAELAPLGDAAPAFGSSAELQSLQGFVVGTWCVIDMEGMKPGYTYVFKSDGTFTTGIKDGDWNASGTWTAGPESISLNYTTMKGKPMQAFIAEYKKDEEGGGQVSVERALYYDDLIRRLNSMTNLWIDEDKKHLTFSRPEPPRSEDGSGGEDEGSSFGDLMRNMGGQLERMGPKKA